MGRQQHKRFKSRCPECLATIWLKEGMELRNPITCPECHNALEVTGLHPPEVDYISSDGDDAYGGDQGDWS